MPNAKFRNQVRAVFAGGFIVAATAGAAICGDWTSASVTITRPDQLTSATGITQLGQGGFQIDANRDYGALVVGGSFSQRGAANRVGIPMMSEADRVDLRAGYDFGRSLGYVILGSHEGTSRQGETDGETVGIGLRVSINRALQLTGEFLHHSFSEREAQDRQRVETISVRAAFRF